MNTARDPLENALADLDAPPPPTDLAARCLATVPARTATAPERRLPFSWLKRGVSMKRLAFAAAALAAVAFWTTRPTLQNDGVTTSAPASAFARTVEAMRHVTFWRTRERQIGFDSGGGKFRYRFDYGWSYKNSWFDAERGMGSDSLKRDGVSLQRDLLTTNGDWYFREGDTIIHRDKVRTTHMGEAYWRDLRKQLLDNIRNPAFHAHNFGRFPTEPPTKRMGMWKGRTAVVFTFDVPPTEEYKRQARPTMRTDLYVDPRTRLIIAKQGFAHWPERPNEKARLTLEQEWDFSERPDAALFDPDRFCEGTDEVQQQNGGPGVILSPE